MDVIAALHKAVREHPGDSVFQAALERYECLHPQNDRIHELQTEFSRTTYDSIEEARAHANEKCLIVYAQGKYTVFDTYGVLEGYYCNAKENIMKVTHEQIIDVQSTQKLVFVYEDTNDERISELKQQISAYFKTDKIAFIPKSSIIAKSEILQKDMYCVISDILGTYDEQKVKFDEFVEYLRNNAKHLVGYCRHIKSEDGYIRMPLEYNSKELRGTIYCTPINIVLNEFNGDIRNLNTGNNNGGNMVIGNNHGNMNIREWIGANPPVADELITKYQKRAMEANGNISKKSFDDMMVDKGFKKTRKNKGMVWQKS